MGLSGVEIGQKFGAPNGSWEKLRRLFFALFQPLSIRSGYLPGPKNSFKPLNGICRLWLSATVYRHRGAGMAPQRCGTTERLARVLRSRGRRWPAYRAPARLRHVGRAVSAALEGRVLCGTSRTRRPCSASSSSRRMRFCVRTGWPGWVPRGISERQESTLGYQSVA